jgi:hypothetical protein
MIVTENRELFDSHQTFLLQKIIEAVHGGIVAFSPPDSREQLQDTVYNIVAPIAALLDGIVVQEYEGRRFAPVVTFAMDPQKTELLGTKGGSWMTEYAYGAVEEFIDQQASA